MVCERCFKALDRGEHGHMKCPLEPRPANGVIPDEIPGGIEIKHALCNEDGSPRRYYSKSAIRKEAEARGYTNYVVHQPPPGTDKSKFTRRWI